MKRSLVQYFILGAAGLLLVTGILKILASFTGHPSLGKMDPIVPFQVRHLILGAGIVEAVFAVLLLITRNVRINLFLICWLASNLAGYRLALWVTNSVSGCFCLGNLGAALGISPRAIDLGLRVVLCYLFVGGFLLLIRDLRSGSPASCGQLLKTGAQASS